MGQWNGARAPSSSRSQRDQAGSRRPSRRGAGKSPPERFLPRERMICARGRTQVRSLGSLLLSEQRQRCGSCNASARRSRRSPRAARRGRAADACPPPAHRLSRRSSAARSTVDGSRGIVKRDLHTACVATDDHEPVASPWAEIRPRCKLLQAKGLERARGGGDEGGYSEGGRLKLVEC